MSGWHSRVRSTLALLVLLLPAGAGAAQPVQADGARAAALATNCLTCHAPGAGPGAGIDPAIPSLAARSAAVIVDALQQFRDGSRSATVMDRIARGYTPEEIALIGAWLGRGQSSRAP